MQKLSALDPDSNSVPSRSFRALRSGKPAPRRTAGVVVALLVCALLGGPFLAQAPAPAAAATQPVVATVAGSDRCATAVAISKKMFASANDVVIATGLDYPDGLTAAPLAGALHAPVLLVPGTSVPSAVSAEITRLGAKHAVVMGGYSSVGPAVEASLVAAGLSVDRVAGWGRFATAAASARATLVAKRLSTANTIFIARGDIFPDALALSSTAAAQSFPLLLTKPSVLSTDAAAVVQETKPAHIVIIGSTAAVSSGIEAALKGMCPDVVRVSGGDRYSTSVQVAKYAVTKGWASPSALGVASGDRFADGLGGGAALGHKGGIMLLTADKALPSVTRTFMKSCSAETSSVAVFGAPPALSTAVTAGIRAVYAPHWVGYYVPGAPLSLTPLSTLESQTGRRAYVSTYFQNTSGGFTRAQAANAVSHGSIPIITLEFWNTSGGVNQPSYNYAAITSGKWDSYLRTYAQSAKAFGGTVWLRPFHEMNGNWYPWCGTVNGNTPAGFVAAWRHVRSIFTAEGATNVKFVWTVNADSVPNTSANSIRTYWPGDAYVDYVGIDGYNFGGTSWRSFSSIFGNAYTTVTGLTSKPIIIPETACSPNGGDKAAWIRDMFTVLPSKFPRIEGFSWFNTNKEADWRIESGSASLSSFKASAVNY